MLYFKKVDGKGQKKEEEIRKRGRRGISEKNLREGAIKRARKRRENAIRG